MSTNGFNEDGNPDGGNTVSVIDERHCQADDVSRCKGPWPTLTVGSDPNADPSGGRDRPADRHALRSGRRRQHRVGVQRRDLQRREQRRLRADAGDGPGRHGCRSRSSTTRPTTPSTSPTPARTTSRCSTARPATRPISPPARPRPRRPSPCLDRDRGRRGPVDPHGVRDRLREPRSSGARPAPTACRCSTRAPATRPCNRDATQLGMLTDRRPAAHRRRGRPRATRLCTRPTATTRSQRLICVAATPPTSPAARPTRPAP